MRKEALSVDKRIYLDHNATTPIHPEVAEAMIPLLHGTFGNPSSIHWAGMEAKKVLDESRQQVADLIGADFAEIFFTSGGSEGDNLAIKGVVDKLRDKGNHIITSQVEHPAVLETCQFLEKRNHRVTYLPVDQYGIINMEDLKEAITDQTVLITLMHANNEIGSVFPLQDIAEIAKENGIIFHCDAVQSVGKIPIDLKKIPVDLLTLSGHKIYGPKGIGALFIRKGKTLTPLIHGGHQERTRRAGTENMPGIVGLAKACEIAHRNFKPRVEKLLKLRNRLEQGIMEKIKHVNFNGHPTLRLPTTVNVGFAFIEGESILLSLDMEGIAASSGSACTSGSLEPSHVLLAMGVSHERAHGSVRFSLGRDNTEEEIDHVLEVLPPIIDRLRSFSPLYREAVA